MKQETTLGKEYVLSERHGERKQRSGVTSAGCLRALHGVQLQSIEYFKIRFLDMDQIINCAKLTGNHRLKQWIITKWLDSLFRSIFFIQPPLYFYKTSLVGSCLLNQWVVSHNEATEAPLQTKALPLMDHEPTVHPQRICTGVLPLEDPGWQQSHYD